MEPYNTKIESIGVMRLSALGDVVWTIPMVNKLKRKYPNAKIVYFCSAPFDQVISMVSGIEVVLLKKPRSFFDYIELKKELSFYEFDILLCTQANLRVNLLYSFINAKRKIGFDKIRGRDLQFLFIDKKIDFAKEHSLEAFNRFAKELNCDDIIDYQLDVPENNFELDESYIAIHPKASAANRTWSIRSYIELITKIQNEMNYNVVLTGGPGDEDIVDQILKKIDQQTIINLCGKTSIPQLASVFKSASVVIACDSGPIHLANAVGSKVIGLYVSLPTYYTGPYGQEENCIDMYEEGLKNYYQLSVEDNWRKRVKVDGMMNLIKVEDVFLKLKNILS